MFESPFGRGFSSIFRQRLAFCFRGPNQGNQPEQENEGEDRRRFPERLINTVGVQLMV